MTHKFPSTRFAFLIASIVLSAGCAQKDFKGTRTGQSSENPPGSAPVDIDPDTFLKNPKRSPDPVSPYSRKLENLRVLLESRPSAEKEEEYLALFPKTFERFYETFYGVGCLKNPACDFGELYDTQIEHVTLLQNLSRRHPEKVLSIRLDIAVNGKWEADAVGFLQHQMMEYAAENTRLFTDSLQARPPAQRAGIIRFLVDVESHEDYEEYQTFLTHLQSAGLTELKQKFLAAQKRREREDDH